MFNELYTLQGLTKIDLTISGDWIAPYFGNRRWKGEVFAEIPIVGMIFIAYDKYVFWARPSFVRSPKLEIELILHPAGQGIQFLFSIGHSGIGDPIVTMNPKDTLPEIPRSRILQTGELFTFASFESTPITTLYVMFLTKQDIKVRRKHIWGLKKALLNGVSPQLAEMLTYGRRGKFSFE